MNKWIKWCEMVDGNACGLAGAILAGVHDPDLYPLGFNANCLTANPKSGRELCDQMKVDETKHLVVCTGPGEGDHFICLVLTKKAKSFQAVVWDSWFEKNTPAVKENLRQCLNAPKTHRLYITWHYLNAQPPGAKYPANSCPFYAQYFRYCTAHNLPVVVPPDHLIGLLRIMTSYFFTEEQIRQLVQIEGLNVPDLEIYITKAKKAGLIKTS